MRSYKNTWRVVLSVGVILAWSWLGAGCSGKPDSQTAAQETPQPEVSASAGSPVSESSSVSAVGAEGSAASAEGEVPASQPSASPHYSGKPNLDDMTLSAKGENPWALRAGKLEYDEDSRRAKVSGVKWNLLAPDGHSKVEVRSQAAEINIDTQGAVFYGPVYATSPKGDKITVQKLVWDSAKKKLIGSKGVKVERKDSTMTGDMMTATPDLKNITVEGNVKIIFNNGLSLDEPQKDEESSAAEW